MRRLVIKVALAVEEQTSAKRKIFFLQKYQKTIFWFIALSEVFFTKKIILKVSTSKEGNSCDTLIRR
jgi:hypothetical protein